MSLFLVKILEEWYGNESELILENVNRKNPFYNTESSYFDLTHRAWVKNVYKWFEIVYELDLINGNGNGGDGRSINRWIEFKL